MAPYNYTISNGSLPPGLSLASTTGTITGTPTTPGSYTFTVTVTDAQNNSANKVFTITIATAVPTCATQPSGLIHWWPANNNSLDIIGGGNATLLNGVQYSPRKSWRELEF
ncbi:MAG: putative Ig domain-containing protein [Blastocatellia bacterium]|nr:putative Ig domain-containing protein [Blastocatellia bacterium]